MLMRPTLAAITLLASAALLSGCGSVTPPPVNADNDAAFRAQLQHVCATTPAPAKLTTGGSLTTLAASAHTAYVTTSKLQQAILNLTPMISQSSPLAPKTADAELMLLDAWKIDQMLVKASGEHKLGLVRWSIGTVHRRLAQARLDFQGIGATDCLAA